MVTRGHFTPIHKKNCKKLVLSMPGPKGKAEDVSIETECLYFFKHNMIHLLFLHTDEVSRRREQYAASSRMICGKDIMYSRSIGQQ